MLFSCLIKLQTSPNLYIFFTRYVLAEQTFIEKCSLEKKKTSKGYPPTLVVYAHGCIVAVCFADQDAAWRISGIMKTLQTVAGRLVASSCAVMTVPSKECFTMTHTTSTGYTRGVAKFMSGRSHMIFDRYLSWFIWLSILHDLKLRNTFLIYLLVIFVF